MYFNDFEISKSPKTQSELSITILLNIKLCVMKQKSVHLLGR